MKTLMRAAAAATIIAGGVAVAGGSPASAAPSTTTCQFGAEYVTVTASGVTARFDPSILFGAVAIDDVFAGDVAAWEAAGSPSTGPADLTGPDYSTTVGLNPFPRPDFSGTSPRRVGSVECVGDRTGDPWDGPYPNVEINVRVVDADSGDLVPDAIWNVNGNTGADQIAFTPSGWSTQWATAPLTGVPGWFPDGVTFGQEGINVGNYEFPTSVTLPDGWELVDGPTCSPQRFGGIEPRDAAHTREDKDFETNTSFCEASARRIAAPAPEPVTPQPAPAPAPAQPAPAPAPAQPAPAPARAATVTATPATFPKAGGTDGIDPTVPASVGLLAGLLAAAGVAVRRRSPETV